MDCEKALEYISASLDGELTGQEQAALDEHLKTCSECRALAAELGALSAGVAALEADPPPGLAERIMANLTQQPAAEPDTKPEPEPDAGDRVVPISAGKRRWRFPRSAAAMLAVAVGLGGVFLWSNLGGTGADSSNLLMQYYAPAVMAPGDMSPASGDGMDGVTADACEPADAVEEEPRASGSCVGGETDRENPDFGAADIPQEPEEAPEPMPAPSNAPATDLTPSNGAVDEPGTAVGATTNGENTASKTEITQDEALDLVFEHLGGYEIYPYALIEVECGYVLTEVEGSGGQGKRRLAFETVSGNEACYIFRLYDSYWSDAGGGERTVTVSRYAVVIEDGRVLEAGDADYKETVGRE